MTPTSSTDAAHWLAQLPEAVLVVHAATVAYANPAARRLFDPVLQRDLTGMAAPRLLPADAEDQAPRGCRLDGSRFAVAVQSRQTRCGGADAELLLVRDVGDEGGRLALPGRLIGLQDAERRHVARELHDEIGQCLSAIRVQFARLQRRVEQPEALALIDSACRMSEATLGQVRSLSLLLHPPQLATLGLVAALRWHLEQQQNLHGLPISFHGDDLPEPIPPDLAIAVFRIVQEALAHRLRHASAGQLSVELRHCGNALRLAVMDDGVGFSPDGMDLGLLGISERARLLGGELSITSAPGMGTHIAARLPLNVASLHDQASRDPGR